MILAHFSFSPIYKNPSINIAKSVREEIRGLRGFPWIPLISMLSCLTELFVIGVRSESIKKVVLNTFPSFQQTYPRKQFKREFNPFAEGGMWYTLKHKRFKNLSVFSQCLAQNIHTFPRNKVLSNYPWVDKKKTGSDQPYSFCRH